MIRSTKWLLLLTALLLSPLFARVARTQTITAASCNSSDVMAALNGVTVDGTTVVIPAGNCTWSSRQTYTQVHSMTIQGQGSPTGTSSDGLNNPTGYNDQTIIQDNSSNTSNGGQVFAVTTAAGKSFRITGISWLMASGNSNNPFHGIVAISGNSHSFRFDHNHVVPAIIGEGLAYDGWLWGVIDHNVFQITTGNNNNLLEVNGDNWNNMAEGGGGDASWADVSNFGGQQSVFVENNYFSGGTLFDCEQGGRMVFRYNTTNNGSFQTHGTGHDTRDRSCRVIEMYGNNSTHTSGQISGTYLDLEGGGYLVWGNTLTNFDRVVQGDNRRTSNETYNQTAPPNGWGYCGAHQTGATSVWDQNLSSDGHFCMDGIGSGKGDMLAGSSFPGVTDQVTGSQTWPNQVHEPVYVWGQSVPGLTTNYWTGGGDTTTTQNREYYLELPNKDNPDAFNGTVGLGCGPASGTGCSNPVARPATCTVGVGYWNPAVTTLYICGSGNTWNAYYAPYTYPHPLVSSSGSGGSGGTSSSLTWGSMDAWLQLDTSTPGTTLSDTILQNGTVSGTFFTWTICSDSGACDNTPISAFTVGATQGGMGGSITVDGTTYPVGTATQSLALAGSQNFTYAMSPSFPTNITKVVANGFVTLASQNTNLMDLVSLYDVLGGYVVMQEPGTGFGLEIETHANGTIHSPTITLQPNKIYSFSLLFDEVGGTAELAVFDPANNFVQVGSTVTVAQSTGSTLAKTFIGNNETGTTTGTTYFEDVMFDWTNHVFPNFPRASSGTTAPSAPTNLSAVVQ